MSLESEIFKKRKPVIEKLKTYGFVQEGKLLKYREAIMDGEFTAIVTVDETGHIEGICADGENGDDYQPIRIRHQNGAYVSKVREAYLNVLERIAEACCIKLPFVSEQANRIAMQVLIQFGEQATQVFEKEETGLVFRNHSNEKWYGLIMPIDRSQISSQSGPVEILNVKCDPDEITKLLREDGFYPAWHMNKKHWVTLTLDETVDDQTIMDLLAYSRGFTLSKKATPVRQGVTAWLIPSNPRMYDIVGHMALEKVTAWKQTSDIQVGDIVYMYVGSPYSAILYRFVAQKVNLTWDYDEGKSNRTRLMMLKRTATYDPHVCTLTKMKQYGVNTVRGPRFMPENLISYLDQQENSDKNK